MYRVKIVVELCVHEALLYREKRRNIELCVYCIWLCLMHHTNLRRTINKNHSFTMLNSGVILLLLMLEQHWSHKKWPLHVILHVPKLNSTIERKKNRCPGLENKKKWIVLYFFGWRFVGFRCIYFTILLTTKTKVNVYSFYIQNNIISFAVWIYFYSFNYHKK